MRRRRRASFGAGFGGDALSGSGREPDRQDRLIPMINVVFLLLTFFLIAGTIRATDGLNIEPPELATEGNLEQQQPVLQLEANGTLYLDGEPVSEEAVVARLTERFTHPASTELHIKADRKTPASEVLPLLRTLREGGFEALRLIAVKKKQSP